MKPLNGKRVLSAFWAVMMMGWMLLAVVPQKTYAENGIFRSFEMTEDELLQIASLCQQEQDSVPGAAAEASLMANIYERNGATGSIHSFLYGNGWWRDSAKFMDKRNARSEIVEVVRKVLAEGKRTLPGYIDEHDCFSDITSCKNNGTAINIRDRSSYQQHVTVITNSAKAVYTFYCFPDSNSDPFGYMSASRRESIGEAYYDVNTWELVGTPIENDIELDIPYPRPNSLLKRGSKGNYVKWLQYALNVRLGYDLGKAGIDGDYGSATENAVSQFQEDYGLSVDGMAGTQTIGKIVEILKPTEPPTESPTEPVTEPAKKWYESYSPQNLGSFYGRISNQSSGLYLTNTGSTVAGAADGQGDAQVWHFIKQEDNSYEIISMLDQGALDVAGGDTANGTDIRSWPDRNGSLAQRFYIYDLFGAVYLRPLNSNLAVDMDLGEGTHNVAIWGYAADWSPQKFVIEKLAPTKAVLQTDKSVYALYEPITFTASSDYAESFTLHLNGKGVRLMNQNMENGVLTFSIDALGTFSAYVTCSNAVGEKNSAKISFTVEGLKVSNEYVILPIEETYAIQANMEELFYKSHNEEIAAVSPEGMITAKNIGTATISISNADDVVLMKVKVVKPFVLGDCDASGTCDVKDLICLQKWIHMKESKEMIQNYAADLNRDGMIDVFDLGLLKHKLLQQ